MSVTQSSWPGGGGVAILLTNETTYNLEPSGLTVFNDGGEDYFYLASDNGNLARRRTDLSDDWVVQSYGTSKANDFESITVAKGQLMIGVEGGSSASTYPQIKRFDTTKTGTSKPLGDFTGSVWNLTDPAIGSNQGMEALTFVPKGSYPSTWGSSNPYYGGLFFAAFQAVPGTIYYYELPQGNATTQNVSSLGHFTTQLSGYKISDICFASGVLYVLYDDTSDYLEEMTMQSSSFQTTYYTQPRYGGVNVVGCEALVRWGNDMYIGLDQSGSSPADGGPTGQYLTNGLANDYVVQYKNYVSHAVQTC